MERETNKEKLALVCYTEIMKGVIPWYNFRERLGLWYDFNDGLEEIKALEKHFVDVEDYEKASDMKEQYSILRDYMIEEDILDKGVLPEYQ